MKTLHHPSDYNSFQTPNILFRPVQVRRPVRPRPESGINHPVKNPYQSDAPY